jgi:hypothetical protein
MQRRPSMCRRRRREPGSRNHRADDCRPGRGPANLPKASCGSRGWARRAWGRARPSDGCRSCVATRVWSRGCMVPWFQAFVGFMVLRMVGGVGSAGCGAPRAAARCARAAAQTERAKSAGNIAELVEFQKEDHGVASIKDTSFFLCVKLYRNLRNVRLFKLKRLKARDHWHSNSLAGSAAVCLQPTLPVFVNSLSKGRATGLAALRATRAPTTRRARRSGGGAGPGLREPDRNVRGRPMLKRRLGRSGRRP